MSDDDALVDVCPEVPKVSTALVVDGRVVPTCWLADTEVVMIKGQTQIAWMLRPFGGTNLSVLCCMREGCANIIDDIKAAMKAQRGNRVKDIRMLDKEHKPIDEVTTIEVRGHSITVLSRLGKGLGIEANINNVKWLMQALWEDENRARQNETPTKEELALAAPSALPPLEILDISEDTDAALYDECNALMASSTDEHLLWCPAKYPF